MSFVLDLHGLEGAELTGHWWSPLNVNRGSPMPKMVARCAGKDGLHGGCKPHSSAFTYKLYVKTSKLTSKGSQACDGKVHLQSMNRFAIGYCAVI